MGVGKKEMVKHIIRYRFRFRSTAFRTIPRVIGIAVLYILFVGCNPVYPDFLSSQTTETPSTIRSTPTNAQPTSSLRPTQVDLVDTPTPTQKPETRQYKHPDDIFELSFPMTWSVHSEGDLTRISNPSNEVSINVQIVNTIYKLNQESLTRTVDAREANVFGEYDSYLETDRQVKNSADSYLVEKRLTEDGEPRVVISQYHQIGQYVLILDMWSGLDYYEGNEPELSSILASLSLDESMYESIENYGSKLLTTFSNGSFSLEVPQYWHYRSALADNSVVDTFISPDEHAVIQMAVYDDGEPISGSVAGAFVRNLLRNYYAKDIIVTSYKYLPDGQEKLIWKSAGSNYEGTTYFDARDTELIIYTVMTETDFKEVYSDLLTYALDSFQSLQSD